MWVLTPRPWSGARSPVAGVSSTGAPRGTTRRPCATRDRTGLCSNPTSATYSQALGSANSSYDRTFNMFWMWVNLPHLTLLSIL